MSLQTIWHFLPLHASDDITRLGMMLAVIASLIQISPIKINPWTWLSKAIQKALGIADLRAEIAQMKIEDIRTQILSFSDDLNNNVNHGEEMYIVMLDFIDDYDRYCIEHPTFTNNRGQAARQNIIDTYKRLKRENAFTGGEKHE